MMRIVFGVIVGFVSWAIAWFGGEQVLSAVFPQGYGVHQRAFQSAIENGGPFTADTTMLLVHIVLGSLVSVLAGFLAALVAGDSTRAPRALGVLLVALGVLKMVMSWPYVPIWYHVLFTALLFPLTLVGGRLYAERK